MTKKPLTGRFSLALKPYTLWAIRRLAEYEEVSMNQYISDVLDAIAEKHDDILKKVWEMDEKARKAVINAD